MLYPNLNYDFMRDIAPVARLGEGFALLPRSQGLSSRESTGNGSPTQSFATWLGPAGSTECFRDAPGRERAAGAGPILNDELLPKPLRKCLRSDAPDDVGPIARRIT